MSLRSKEQLAKFTGHTGKGQDRKGTKADGLKLDWMWLRVCDLSGGPARDKRRLPCQTCYATAQVGKWTLEFAAIAGRTGTLSEYQYEPELSINGSAMERVRENEYHSTRLGAQKAAEKLPAKYIASLQQVAQELKLELEAAQI